jgi:hypothetical protein
MDKKQSERIISDFVQKIKKKNIQTNISELGHVESWKKYRKNIKLSTFIKKCEIFKLKEFHIYLEKNIFFIKDIKPYIIGQYNQNTPILLCNYNLENEIISSKEYKRLKTSQYKQYYNIMDDKVEPIIIIFINTETPTTESKILSKLNNDCILHILEFLSKYDYHSLFLSCRFLNHWASSNEIWMKYSKTIDPSNVSLIEENNIQTLFKKLYLLSNQFKDDLVLHNLRKTKFTVKMNISRDFTLKIHHNYPSNFIVEFEGNILSNKIYHYRGLDLFKWKAKEIKDEYILKITTLDGMHINNSPYVYKFLNNEKANVDDVALIKKKKNKK